MFKYLFSAFAMVASLNAGAAQQEDTVSASDAKLLIEVAKHTIEVDGCEACKTPGYNMDLKNPAVKVKLEDLKLRDSWISEVEKELNDSRGTLKRCKMTQAPKVLIDAAVIKAFQIRNNMANVVVYLLGEMASACSNPENLDNIAFAKKIKVIHATVARPWPKGDCMGDKGYCGYNMKFDEKTGVLTVGFHDHATNVDRAVRAWLESQ